MENLKAGDVVVLKSGGPKMTISKIHQNHEFVTCTWFDGSNVKSHDFVTKALKIYESPKLI